MFAPMAQLHDLTALEQGSAIRSGEVSPTELVDHYLARIERWSEEVGAFVTVTDELARAQAKLAGASVGDDSSSLYGVPNVIKDLMPPAVVVTEYGSSAMVGHMPEISDQL